MSTTAAPPTLDRLLLDREGFDDEHRMFRASARAFAEQELRPHDERWRAQGHVDRSLFARAADRGMLGMAIPERFGGPGVDDFRFNQVLGEELQRAGVGPAGQPLVLHNDVVLPYLLRYADPEQQERWLPGCATGETVLAVAMSEPGAGSDLAALSTRAVRDGDAYVVTGAKTFITAGTLADLFVVAVKTDPRERHRGISLLVIDGATPGLTRGRPLHKLGNHAQDTVELFFEDCRVPVADRLGDEGAGFAQLMANLPQERLSIAVAAVAAARRALELTLEHVRAREAFGQPIGSFQHSRFTLADLATEIALGQTYVDRCAGAHVAGRLTAQQAAMAKWWCTEMLNRVCDRCVQLHGGYGYMAEYDIGRQWVDARVTTIYGGTTEIMKEIVGRGLGL